MIDIGRKKDMEMLMKLVNNPHENILRRRSAYRRVQSIKRKMSDKTIQKLRLRLIAASLHDDPDEQDRISHRIQEHERKHHHLRRL